MLFLEETAGHLMGTKTAVDQESLIARLPEMQAGTNPFLRILLDSGHQGQGIFFPTGPGLASERAWVVEQLVGFMGKGLHLCGDTSEYLPDIRKTYGNKQFDYLCVKERPMIRNVLQALRVKDLNHVYGDGEWVDLLTGAYRARILWTPKRN